MTSVSYKHMSIIQHRTNDSSSSVSCIFRMSWISYQSGFLSCNFGRNNHYHPSRWDGLHISVCVCVCVCVSVCNTVYCRRVITWSTRIYSLLINLQTCSESWYYLANITSSRWSLRESPQLTSCWQIQYNSRFC